MTERSELITVYAYLADAEQAMRDRLAVEFPGVSPYEVRDGSGRFVLADILVARANVATALAMTSSPAVADSGVNLWGVDVPGRGLVTYETEQLARDESERVAGLLWHRPTPRHEWRRVGQP